MSRRVRIVFALVSALLLAACGGGGGAPQRKEVVLQTRDDDRRVGEEASRQVGGQMGIVDDPELSAYIAKIGSRLARAAPRSGFRYQFQIVDQDAPNAFALPGGYIYVSRGLLTLANDEDEVAGVLGHEIIHVAARHAAARQSMVKGMPGPMAYLAQGAIAGYGRDQEREADRLGQGLAAVAGYDPNGLPRFLESLELGERLRLGASRLPGFYDTHPATAERVATASSRAGMVSYTPKPPIAKDRAGYLHRIEGLLVGTSASEGSFVGDRFMHPELGFMIRYPSGWDYQNTRQAVGAVAPTRDGVVFLEHHGMGDDPEAAAQAFMNDPQAQGLSFEDLARVKIGHLKAARASGRTGSPAGPVIFQITFIAFEGSIYRVTGFSFGGSTGRYDGTIRNVARSFRPLPPGLRGGLTEKRLRLAVAERGDTIETLSQRSGNKWDIQTTSVMNAVYANVSFEGGEVVKIAVSEEYVPAPGSTASR